MAKGKGRMHAWQRQCATLYVLLWRIGAQFRSNRNCECATETHNNGNNKNNNENNNNSNSNGTYAMYTADSGMLVQKMVQKNRVCIQRITVQCSCLAANFLVNRFAHLNLNAVKKNIVKYILI